MDSIRRLALISGWLLLLLPPMAFGLTEAELLLALGTKFDLVGEARQSSRRGDNPRQFGETTLLEKEVTVVDITNNTVNESLIRYFTDQAGNAYWKNREPKPPATTTPREEIQAYIDARIADGTFQFAQASRGSGSEIVYDVILPDDSSAQVLVTRSSGGTIAHKTISGSVR